MKTINRFLCLALLAVCYVWVTVSCTTNVTRTITTDKEGTVTDTTVTAKGVDPAALKLAEVVAAVRVPRRAMAVRDEKAVHEMRRLLRGWRGPAAVAVAVGEVKGERRTLNTER